MPTSDEDSRERTALIDVALLVLATLAVRAVLFGLTSNESGDPDSRALWGATVHREFAWITSGFWLPFQPYAISLLMHATRDPLLAGKLLSLASGVLAAVPLYALVRLEFDRRTALLAGAMLALYGLHAGLSVVVMTESTFVLLSLCGLWVFVREMRNARPRLVGLCASAALMALAGGWRHEAWQLTGLMMLWLVIDRRTRAAAVPFAVIGFSAFGLWSVGNMLAGNGPLYALTGVASQKEKELAFVTHSALSNVAKWIWAIVESPGPLIGALMIAGLWLSFFRKRVPVALSMLSLLMVAPYVVLSVVKTEWRPQQRYVVLTVILLLPYAAAAFWHLFGRSARFVPALATLLVVTVIGQGLAFARHSSLGLPVRDYAALDVETWSWMAANLDERDRVVVEDVGWRSPGIILHSGRWRTPHAMVHPHEPSDAMERAIASVGATVLVLPTEGKHPAFVSRLATRELHRNADWTVLRIEGAQ